jgi:hypothetical protein
VRLFLHGLLPRAAAPVEEPQAGDPSALEEENRRLRKLLVEAMLETAALKEAGAQG